MVSGEEKYEKAYKTFQGKVIAFINKRLKDQKKTITEQTAEAFVEGARNRLLMNSQPAPESNSLIQDIAYSIYYEMVDEKAKVVIPRDEEGLIMFLEYGTGLIGESDPHETAKIDGWAYNIKKHEHGWSFEDNGDNYIDANDKTSQKTQWVWTQGIKPVRYVYNTKRELSNILSRKNNTKGYRQELEKIKRNI